MPAQLGNGQDPKSNLYWGALYGLRTHLARSAGWEKLSTVKSPEEHILERAVFRAGVQRNGSEVAVYLVADAWDGAHIKGAIDRFLEQSAGDKVETIRLAIGPTPVELQAGGAAHLVAYVGHNGLMEFSVSSSAPESPDEVPRSSLVLACASKEYFAGHLNTAGSHALLLTTGLMAPEAYALDAAVRAWVSDGSTASVVEAAAVAYNRYQKCGLRGARRLFWGSP